MAVTGTRTVRNICLQALWKAGITSTGTNAEADEFERALDDLNWMLKSWQQKRYNLWTGTYMTVTATATATQTLDPVRPMSIDGCRFKQGGSEMPMIPMTREEYDNLPVKTTTGTPTSYFYDRQRENAVLYVWPILSSATGQTFEITYTRELDDVSTDTISSTIDVPVEWYEAVIYNLADRLCDTFEIDSPYVRRRAEMSLREALAFDREESVWFGASVG